MKYKSRILKIFKLAVFVAICGVVYSQSSMLLREWHTLSLSRNEVNVGYLFLTFLGLFLNILLEYMKWRSLTGRIEKISYCRTIASILSGIALSIITPQRLGDVAGRLVGFKSDNFPRLIAVQLLGGMIQISVVLFFGGISLICLNLYFAWFSNNSYTVIFYIVFFLFLVILNAGIFKTRWMIDLTQRIPVKGKLKKWLESIHVINTFTFYDIVYLYFLTIMRYLVYTTQFLLLAEFLGQPSLNWASLGAVYLLFFIQAGVPLPPLFSLVVRGSLAMQVWAMIGFSGYKPLIASYMLWIINLGIPALLGAFNLIYFKKDKND